MATLAHEIVHTTQSDVILKAAVLFTQNTGYPSAIYDYSLSSGVSFSSLNIEQQAAVVQDMYRVANGLPANHDLDAINGPAPTVADFMQAFGGLANYQFHPPIGTESVSGSTIVYNDSGNPILVLPPGSASNISYVPIGNNPTGLMPIYQIPGTSNSIALLPPPTQGSEQNGYSFNYITGNGQLDTELFTIPVGALVTFSPSSSSFTVSGSAPAISLAGGTLINPGYSVPININSNTQGNPVLSYSINSGSGVQVDPITGQGTFVNSNGQPIGAQISAGAQYVSQSNGTLTATVTIPLGRMER